MPEGGHFAGTPQPKELPPFLGLFFETPASIACLYHLVRHSLPGCDPDLTTENPSGGGGAIAIVDAFDNPNAASDLAAFNAQFGLATADFQVIYAGGTQPTVDPSGGWELEESLDLARPVRWHISSGEYLAGRGWWTKPGGTTSAVPKHCRAHRGTYAWHAGPFLRRQS